MWLSDSSFFHHIVWVTTWGGVLEWNYSVIKEKKITLKNRKHKLLQYNNNKNNLKNRKNSNKQKKWLRNQGFPPKWMQYTSIILCNHFIYEFFMNLFMKFVFVFYDKANHIGCSGSTVSCNNNNRRTYQHCTTCYCFCNCVYHCAPTPVHSDMLQCKNQATIQTSYRTLL